MLRLAVIGIGNSGMKLLAQLHIPAHLFLLGASGSAINMPDPGIPTLAASRFSRLACNYDCIFLAGDPCEQDFGALMQALCRFLSERICFLGAFLLAGDDRQAFRRSLSGIARYANCCFKCDKTRRTQTEASLYLGEILDIFHNAYSGNLACVDLIDAAALFRGSLAGFACSGSAGGKHKSMQAASDLSEQLKALNSGKVIASLLHISCPHDTSFTEIAKCCEYLMHHNHLGGWLFSASSIPDQDFKIDIICASPLEANFQTEN